MNTTLREMLTRRAEEAGPPDLDIRELVRLGEARLRRRRVAAAAGSAAVAAVVVVTLVLGAVLHSSVRRGDGPPVDRPSPSPTETHASPVRQLLYIDVAPTRRERRQGVIHYGDRTIESGDAFVHTDVTDDGFVYTSRDDAWFSDGGSPEHIGSRLCELRAIRHGGILHLAQNAVMTGTAGSLVVWFECTRTAPETLVVYDTAARRTVARRPMEACGTGSSLADSCTLYALTGGHVYLNQGVYAGHPRPEYRLDVTTGRFSATTRTAYAADIRSRPRGLVVGDTWETGTTTDGGPSFRVVGSRLAPQLTVDSDTHLAKAAFDTATRRTVQLRLPPGYHPRQGASYGIFEWLDDDTIALTPDHNLSSADILTCQLSDGRCRLAVPAGPDDVIRILPSQGLPG